MKDLNKQKIFWHSRRGMLELDLLLVPFTRDVFDDLSSDEQLLYRGLLQQEDQDLYALLMRSDHPESGKYRSITSKIIAHNKSQL